jgi:hypothetical protein
MASNGTGVVNAQGADTAMKSLSACTATLYPETQILEQHQQRMLRAAHCCKILLDIVANPTKYSI